MNFNVRQAVLQNVQDMDQKGLRNLIEDSIQQGEEKLLPGLGVLFEVIWRNSNDNNQEQMIDTLRQQL